MAVSDGRAVDVSIDRGRIDRQLYLVLDYVNGGELFFHLERNGPFTEAEAKIYAAEIIIAIDSLHQRNIVYRYVRSLDPINPHASRARCAAPALRPTRLFRKGPLYA